jgi:uncharacterized Zn finger protein (UPF0148 family)
MNCPNCGASLRPGAAFCPNCGQQVPAQPASPPPPTVHQPQPPTPSSGAQPPEWTIPSSAKEIGQVGSSGQTSSIWGPFAGQGSRREHVAWLLQGSGDRAEELRDTIADLFGHRRIPNAQIDRVTLTGKGVAIEQRPFYRIRRGLATVWLYVARFGEDLYVSQVSYIKGSISLGRLLIASGLIGLVGLSGLNGMAAIVNVQNSISSLGLFGGGSEPSGFLIGSLCCTGPMGGVASLALTLGAAYSFYKFIAEKDILALFRSPPNEFQEDDIVSMEKAVNETVRQAADLIGIDRKLLAPGRAYRSSQRLI